MTIRCGTSSSNISRVYCGSNQITRVYCGSNLVFGAAPLPAAPTTVRVTFMNTTGSISARSGVGMVGSASSGLVVGGRTATTTVSGDSWRYSATSSRVTITALTETGTFTARGEMAMSGSSSSGVILGGATGSYGDLYHPVWYSRSGNTLRFTSLSQSGRTTEFYSAGNTGIGTSTYTFGGISGTSRINQFNCYSATTARISGLRITTSGASISARSGSGMVGVADGIIFGGYNGSSYLNDFYKYTISGNTATITALTRTGTSISGRENMGMVGDENAGIIYGGWRGSVLSDWYHYAVSGNTIRISSLRRTGSSIVGRFAMGMVGTATTGLMFGGSLSATRRSSAWFRYAVS